MKSEDAGAFLALWNDIDEARIEEYERWHTLEHVPERVWVPGFHSGTRYVALTGSFSRYFTLYELDALGCLASAEYQGLVERPTPWSASMRPSFRNFLRKTCTMQSDLGRGQGAGVLVVRAVWPQDQAAPALDAFNQRLLERGAESCAMRVQAGKVQRAGPQALANVDPAPDGAEYIFIVHTSRPEDLERLCRTTEKVMAEALAAPTWKHSSHYQVSSTVRHSEVAQPARPSPRHDLMPNAAPGGAVGRPIAP